MPISQSLAGRTAPLRLLPFSLAERRRARPHESVDELLHRGFYPRILDQDLEPRQAYEAYFETYVERDLRQLAEIRNLSSFRRFVRLCAGRVGQLVNLSSLGADAGVSHTTAREWLTLLEASYIAFVLPPYFREHSKAPGQVTQDLLLRRGFGVLVLLGDRTSGTDCEPSAPGSALREHGHRGGPEVRLQSRPFAPVSSFFRDSPGSGMRPS